MIPLAITARLDPLGGPLSLPNGYIHLDGPVAYAVVIRDGIRPAMIESELVPIEIPIEREPKGRFHLASAAYVRWEIHEKKFTNRRFPVERAAVMSTMTRVRIDAGAQKSYRIPLEVGRVEGDALTWYAIGEPEELRSLLALLPGIGKRRGVGLGAVREWLVEQVEAWPGFPVLTPTGEPLRHLPAEEYPRPTDVRIGRLTYPYWLRTDETMVTVPVPVPVVAA